VLVLLILPGRRGGHGDAAASLVAATAASGEPDAGQAAADVTSVR
jgi:hypothetical protein